MVQTEPMAIVVSAIIAGAVTLIVNAIINPFFEASRERKRLELKKQIADSKCFSERQREIALDVLNNLKAFYALEQIYMNKVAELRRAAGATTFDKRKSVQVEARGELEDGLYITYRPSKYNEWYERLMGKMPDADTKKEEKNGDS